MRQDSGDLAFQRARHSAGSASGESAGQYTVGSGTEKGNATPFCAIYVQHPGGLCYSSSMATRRKAASTRSVRQSVTIPASLVSEVRRAAKEQHVTMSRALVALAERGVRAEAEAKEQLKASYDRFRAENDPARKNEAGKDLIRTIFGKDAIAEDSIL
jgi:hypothetical protein